MLWLHNQTNYRRRLDGHYSRLRLRTVSKMRIKHTVTPRARRFLQRNLPPDLSREAMQRLKWIEHFETRGQNVSLTCRHFDISRPTFYRWHKRYDPKNLRALEDRKCMPKRWRQPTWSPELARAVRELREQYPSWGKDKLAVLLHRKKIEISTSMVGRILKRLKHTGELVEAPRFGISVRKRRLKRTYAIRKPKEYQATEPGDKVEVDTLDVGLLPGVRRKQFTARDVVSRYDVVGICGSATAKTAAEFLDEIIERMPFEVKAIQIDNGSEYMAEFEQACQARGLKLFVLPPRSPKLNGHVERAQRTHTEEHWELSTGDTDLESMRRELLAWEKVYNTIRPHQSLGYLTPEEYVDNWKVEQASKQQTVAV
jgi:putative transposase